MAVGSGERSDGSGTIWTSGQEPLHCGRVEEHHGIWCNGGLPAAAAMRCIAG
jgi:hypothetical protein